MKSPATSIKSPLSIGELGFQITGVRNEIWTSEIGRRAGFSDPSHFARVFRRHTGSTPAQIRHRRI